MNWILKLTRSVIVFSVLATAVSCSFFCSKHIWSPRSLPCACICLPSFCNFAISQKKKKSHALQCAKFTKAKQSHGLGETMIHKLEQTSSHTEVCGLMLTAGGGGGGGLGGRKLQLHGCRQSRDTGEEAPHAPRKNTLEPGQQSRGRAAPCTLGLHNKVDGVSCLSLC